MASLLPTKIVEAFEKRDWYLQLKTRLDTKTKVSFALYKQISDKWTTLMGKDNPLPFTLASLYEGLPVPGGSVTDVLPGDTLQAMFSIAVPTSEMRDLFTVYPAQKECEVAMNGEFLPNNYREKLTKKIDEQVQAGTFSGIVIGLQQTIPITILENGKPETYQVKFKKSGEGWDDNIDMTREAPGFYVELLENTTKQIMQDPSTRDADGNMGVNFLITGRVFCGFCWLCGFPVWCYFGKEVLPDGSIKSESVIFTSCGECEHKGAVWASVISFMLARIQRGSALGRIGYGNSHVKCNQDKERMVGFRWNGPHYMWEVNLYDITIIVNTILDNGPNGREYDSTLAAKLQSIKDSRDSGDQTLYLEMIARIKTSYEEWVDAANSMLRTESEMQTKKSRGEMADRWLCRMTYCFAEEYGLAWLKKLAKLNEKAYNKKAATLKRRFERSIGTQDKKEEDKYRRAIDKLQQVKNERQDKFRKNRESSGGALSKFTEYKDDSDLNELEKLVYKKTEAVFNFLIDIYDYDIPDMDTEEYAEEFELYNYSALNEKYRSFMNDTGPTKFDFTSVAKGPEGVEASVFQQALRAYGGSRKTAKQRGTKRAHKKPKKNTKRRNRKH